MYALIALYPAGLKVNLFPTKLEMEHEHYNARNNGAKRIAVGKIKKGATEASLREAFTKDWSL